MLEVKDGENQIIKVVDSKTDKGSKQDGQISAEVTCASGK